MPKKKKTSTNEGGGKGNSRPVHANKVYDKRRENAMYQQARNSQPDEFLIQTVGEQREANRKKKAQKKPATPKKRTPVDKTALRQRAETLGIPHKGVKIAEIAQLIAQAQRLDVASAAQTHK
jgi:hypothetical protein